MTLTVCSSSPLYRGSDTLDVTRLGIVDRKPDSHGILFAPSWGILKPYLKARKEWEALEREAGDLGWMWDGAERIAIYAQADRMKRETWAWYEPAYIQEMRDCYKAHRSAWQTELARARRVYQCFCPIDKTKPIEEQHCHRIVLRSIFVKLGAVDGGEL